MIFSKLISEVNMSPSFSSKEVMSLPVGLIGFEIEGIFVNQVDIRSMYPDNVDEDYELDMDDVQHFNISSLKESLFADTVIGKYLQNVEEDESIKVRDQDKQEFFGAEVITKPIPSNIAFDVLQDIFDILRQEYGFHTNHSTGFHINISNIYTEKKQPIDLVKLMLFLGETHELEQYKRSNNMYASNIYELVRSIGDRFTNNLTDVNSFISKTNEFIKKENKTSKYLSFNPRTLENGYMEFRIAGGEGYQNDIEKLKNSANRYMRCLYIACKPDLQRREYYKKATQLMHYAASQIHSSQNDAETIVSILKKLDMKFSNKLTYNQIQTVDDLELFHARGIMYKIWSMGAYADPDEQNPLFVKNKPFFTVREKRVLSQLYNKYKDKPYIDEKMLQALQNVISHK